MSGRRPTQEFYRRGISRGIVASNGRYNGLQEMMLVSHGSNAQRAADHVGNYELGFQQYGRVSPPRSDRSESPIREHFAGFANQVNVVPQVLHSGPVYDVFEGSYGRITSVIIKRPKAGRDLAQEIENANFAKNEAWMLEEFRDAPYFARLLHRHADRNKIQLVVEKYEMNLATHFANLSMQRGKIDLPSIARQLLIALSHMEKHHILHSSLKLKNMYVKEVSGKRICDFQCFQN